MNTLRTTAVAIAILFGFTNIMYAQGMPTEMGYIAPGHQQFHWWYQYIQKELGISGCCNSTLQDCGPVTDYEDRGVAGLRIVLEDGLWYDASDARKFYVPTPDGKAHACRLPVGTIYGVGRGTGFNFYCVFLPSPGV